MKRIVLVLLVLLSVMTMTGLASVGAIAEESGTDNGEATVGLVSPVSQPPAEQPIGAYVGEGINPEPEVSIPEGEGEVVPADPVIVDNGGNTGGNTGGGYESVSIAVPDRTSESSDAIASVATASEVPSDDSWVVGPPEIVPSDTWEVQPPEIVPPDDSWVVGPPEIVPPEVGTCEYPGHPPCSPIEVPDVWIMPQWLQWFPWRFA